MRDGLQPGLGLEVGAQPGRGHGARGQAGDAGELDNVLVAGLGQHALELGVRVALGGDGKRRAELHCGRAERLQADDVGVAANAAGGDQRHLALDAGRAQEFARLGQHALEVEARVGQVGDARRAEVAAGQPRVFDDDRIGQALLALPFAHDQRNAARIRQDRHQRGARVLGGELGQVQRQAGTDDHRVDAGFERGADLRGVLGDRAHDVDGKQPEAAGELARAGDLAAQRFEVGGVDRGLGLGLGLRADARGQALRARHQVGVVAAQVDRAERADTAKRGDAAGQPVRRHAHAHAALDDGQHAAPGQPQRRQPAALEQRGDSGKDMRQDHAEPQVECKGAKANAPRSARH